MKKLFRHISLLKAMLALATFVAFVAKTAHAAVPIPTLTRPVIDNGQFIPDAQEPQIEQRIRDLFASGGPQLVVWTLEALDGEDIAQLGIRAADTWKLGREKTDDGLILLISRAERRTRLEVGHGLEGTIPDIIANRLLQSVIRPALRANQFGDGVLSLIENINKLTHDPEARKKLAEESQQSLPIGRQTGFLLLLALVVIISIIDRLRPNSFQRGRRFGRSGIWWGGGVGGGWGGGSSRGGGSWGGGGGSFGGGGSSGDW